MRVARALGGAGLKLRAALFTGGQAEEKARATTVRTQKASTTARRLRCPLFAYRAAAA